MSERDSDRVGARLHELVLAEGGRESPGGAYPAKPLWAAVKRTGSELWLDTGDMDEIGALWCAEFSALTTNNTLLNREVQKGIYDDLVARAAKVLKGTVPHQDLVLEIAFVLNAVHGLRLTRRFGAKVSVELHTDLSFDVDRAVAYGRRLHAVAPEDFYVKVPLTAPGLLAARRLTDEGVAVNFTLGFSARQNVLIAAIARPAFVNVFLGRLNAFVADHGLGSGRLIGEKATLASQRAVQEVREALGTTTRQIAASMRDGEQVLTLAGVDVLTMPPKVAGGFEKLAPEPETVASQADSDPDIELAEGVDRQALGLDGLWDVPDDLKAVARELGARDPSRLAPEDIAGLLAERGFPDVLTPLSHDDLDAIRSDGKIPKLDRWRERLAEGQVGLDTLMNLSGLCAFETDQRAMDDRIRSML